MKNLKHSPQGKVNKPIYI